jgi:hypothetical protein
VGPNDSVGAWLPWELGFFDGSISDRIGIYLLDGRPADFNPEKYFKGSEYLQVKQAAVIRLLSRPDRRDDSGHHESDRLAATFGPRLLCRGGS